MACVVGQPLGPSQCRQVVGELVGEVDVDLDISDVGGVTVDYERDDLARIAST